LDAVIFDFDGVVVDSEPIHLRYFQAVLSGAGIELTRDEYYGKYLGYDDHDCIVAVGRDNSVRFSQSQVVEMVAAKTKLVKRALAESIPPMPGAVELICSLAAGGAAVGVCSGALREEIEMAAGTVGVLEHFAAIVSAEDVPRGKPDPAGYDLARRRLEDVCRRDIAPARCVVVEDAPAGITAARAAGMKVLAVTTSYVADELTDADRIVASLAEVTPADLERLLK
jgi:beta-phosphoglucomutase